MNFTVEKGDAVGIIGRNGAGKSTILKILSQITYPTEGEVVLVGRVGSLLEVGTGFHPELTGRENVFLNGAILGMKKKEIEDKYDDIVKFAEVEKFLDTPIKRYSSGMYLRLAFAVAAHLEPDILIADEVLAVGDQQFQQKCLGKMKEVTEEGRTVIFVSHNLHAIRSLCKTGVFLEKGRMIDKGPVDDVITRYSHSLGLTNDEFPVQGSGISVTGFEIYQKGRPTNLLDGTDPFEIVIGFELPERSEMFRMGVFLNNAMGDEIVRSFFSDWDRTMETMGPGRYVAKLTFPEKLVSPGNYSFTIGASKLGTDMLEGHRIEMAINISAPLDFNPGMFDQPYEAQIFLDRRWNVRPVN